MPNFLLSLKNDQCDIYWRKVVPDDYEEVKDVILNNYIKWEPLSLAVGLNLESGALDAVVNIWESVTENQSICAYDPSKNNKIVAICMISGPYSPTRKPSQWVDEKQQPEKLKQIYRMLNCLSFGQNTNMETHAGQHKFMKALIVSVIEEYLHLGLGRALICKSLELAKSAGCKYLFAELTSAYTARIFQQEGAKVLHEIIYSDYTDPVSGQKCMAHCKQPHCSATLVAVEL